MFTFFMAKKYIQGFPLESLDKEQETHWHCSNRNKVSMTNPLGGGGGNEKKNGEGDSRITLYM